MEIATSDPNTEVGGDQRKAFSKAVFTSHAAHSTDPQFVLLLLRQPRGSIGFQEANAPKRCNVGLVDADKVAQGERVSKTEAAIEGAQFQLIITDIAGVPQLHADIRGIVPPFKYAPPCEAAKGRLPGKAYPRPRSAHFERQG